MQQQAWQFKHIQTQSTKYPAVRNMNRAFIFISLLKLQQLMYSNLVIFQSQYLYYLQIISQVRSMSKFVGFKSGFLQKSALQSKLKRQQKMKKQRQIQQKKNREMANFDIQEKMIHNQVPNDQIVNSGKIVRVNRGTLIQNEFRVQCQYKGEMTEVIADRDQIMQKNIGALLNFYEKLLGLDIKAPHT